MNLFPIIIGLILAAMIPLAHAEENAIHVGRSAAGQLKFGVNFPLPLELLPSVFPGRPGYATGDLGIHVKQIAILCLNCFASIALDGIGKIKKYGES